jgi:hypothetical protein
MRGEVVMVSPLFAAFASENERHINIVMTTALVVYTQFIQSVITSHFT